MSSSISLVKSTSSGIISKSSSSFMSSAMSIFVGGGGSGRDGGCGGAGVGFGFGVAVALCCGEGDFVDDGTRAADDDVDVDVAGLLFDDVGFPLPFEVLGLGPLSTLLPVRRSPSSSLDHWRIVYLRQKKTTVALSIK